MTAISATSFRVRCIRALRYDLGVAVRNSGRLRSFIGGESNTVGFIVTVYVTVYRIWYVKYTIQCGRLPWAV